jgi:hypothetical protein
MNEKASAADQKSNTHSYIIIIIIHTYAIQMMSRKEVN